jgi:hypothetical protein
MLDAGCWTLAAGRLTPSASVLQTLISRVGTRLAVRLVALSGSSPQAS